MRSRSSRRYYPGFVLFFQKVFLTVPLIIFSFCSVPYAMELDLWTYLRFHYEHEDLGDENYIRMYNDLRVTNIIKDRLDVHFSGWFNYNPSSSGGFGPVDYDYYRIANGYLLIKFLDPKIFVTLGRQYLDNVDNFMLDGGQVNYMAGRKWEVFAFGGRPVSFYSSDEGEYMFGGGLIYKPWWQTTIQIDGFALRESGLLYDAEALRITQMLPFNTQSYNRLRLLRGEVRDYYTTLSSYFEKIGTAGYLNFYLQPEIRGAGQQAESKYFSYYGQIFGSTYPYYMVNLQLQKFIGEHWVLIGGAAYKRLLKDSGPLAVTNVDSDVYNGGVTYLNLLIKGLDATILGNFVRNENDQFFDVTGELDYRISDKLTASTGLTYTGYKFSDVKYIDTWNGQPSVYNLADRIGSEIFFVDFGYRPRKDHKVSLMVSYENIDKRYDNAATVQLTYQFHFSLGNSDPAGEQTDKKNRTESNPSQ